MNDFDIVTEDLTKRFGRLLAVDRVNLRVKKGEIFGFLGPNGAGKTTLIRMLCAILKPTSGKGWVGGFDIEREPEKVKSQIGYMSQRFGLYEDLTVAENLDFYAGIYLQDRQWARKRKEEVLEEVGLSPQRSQLAGELSGGFKQRLALASAIVHQPKILFLDEPTSGVDPVSRREIWDLIYTIAAQGTTLFVTTHYMEEAERCNRIGFIHNGRLLAMDSPERIKSNLMEGEVLNIHCDNPNQGLRSLLTHELVKNANIYGDNLHAVVDDAKAAIPVLRKFLQQRGIKVTKVALIEASIEDVFVELTGKEK